MKNLIEALEKEIARRKNELAGLQNALDTLRSATNHKVHERITEIAASADPSSKVERGQWKGLRPHQAIAAYLRARGNPGVTLAEITDALLADGTVLSKDLQYPLRSTSGAVKHAKHTFRVEDAKHAEDTVVYLK
jgi:hypothetical protein